MSQNNEQSQQTKPTAELLVRLQALVEIAACPVDHSRLRIAPDALVDRLNTSIERRELRDASATLIDAPLQGGLVRADGDRLYPVRDGIAVLLPEAGILLDDDDRKLL